MRSTSRTKHSPRKTKFDNSGCDWLRGRAATSLHNRWAPARDLVKGASANIDESGEGCRLGLLSMPRHPGLRPIPLLPSGAESVQTETCRSPPSLFCEIGNSTQCRPNSAHGSFAQPPARQRPASFSCTGQFLASPRERNHFVGRLICEPWEYGVFTPPDLGYLPTFLNPRRTVKL